MCMPGGISVIGAGRHGRIVPVLFPDGLRDRRRKLAPVVRRTKPPAGVQAVFEVDQILGRIHDPSAIVTHRPIQHVHIARLNQIWEQGEFLRQKRAKLVRAAERSLVARQEGLQVVQSKSTRPLISGPMNFRLPG